MSVAITEEYNVLVSSEELIGNHRMSEVIDEVSHKPMSLYPGSTVFSIHSSHIFEKALFFFF